MYLVFKLGIKDLLILVEFLQSVSLFPVVKIFYHHKNSFIISDYNSTEVNQRKKRDAEVFQKGDDPDRWADEFYRDYEETIRLEEIGRLLDPKKILHAFKKDKDKQTTEEPPVTVEEVITEEPPPPRSKTGMIIGLIIFFLFSIIFIISFVLLMIWCQTGKGCCLCPCLCLMCPTYNPVAYAAKAETKLNGMIPGFHRDPKKGGEEAYTPTETEYILHGEATEELQLLKEMLQI